MTDFKSILEQHQIPFVDGQGEHEHGRDGWINFDCPWCSKGWGHYRMGFNTSAGYVNCWSCGKHGLVATLVELLSLPYNHVSEILQDLPRVQRRRSESLSASRTLVPDGVGPLLPAHANYLQGRNFNPRRTARRWGLKGIGTASRLAWRLFIPIFLHGEMVSWTTRSIQANAHQRYHSAKPTEEKFCHKHLLYGEDEAKDTIIIVEGPPSVWRIGPGAVALFGTGFTRSQVLRMASYPVRVVCLDNESFAQKKARELCKLLQVFEGRTYNVVMETGKAPDEASDEEVQELRERFL